MIPDHLCLEETKKKKTAVQVTTISDDIHEERLDLSGIDMKKNL